MPDAATLERRTRAVELLAAGRTYDEIAVALGYANRSGAWKAVQGALKAVESDVVEEYRALSLQRQDALLERLWPAAMDGDLKAVASVRRIVDSQCRLLGLL